jgi:hypothetical protein
MSMSACVQWASGTTGESFNREWTRTNFTTKTQRTQRFKIHRLRRLRRLYGLLIKVFVRTATIKDHCLTQRHPFAPRLVRPKTEICEI